MSDWDGVYVFPVTAMDEAGENLDIPRYRAHVEWLIEAGVSGVMPLGSTGEFAYLNRQERTEIIAATVEQADGRVPTIAGVSAISTRDAVEYARHAESVGAAAVLVLLQSYFQLSPDQIVAHFERISTAIEIPIFVYNNPWSSHHDIDPDLAERLVDQGGVKGLKESTGGLDRVMELQDRLGDRLVLHCGWEHLALPMFLLGVRGWSTATANLVPEKCVEMYRLAVEERNFDAALEIHVRIAPLAKYLLELPLASAVKTGLSLLGDPAGSPRPPLTPLDGEATERLRLLLEVARSSDENAHSVSEPAVGGA